MYIKILRETLLYIHVQVYATNEISKFKFYLICFTVNLIKS